MSHPTHLEHEFEAALRAVIQQAAELTPPVKFNRLNQMIDQYGGKSAAVRVLENSKISEGFINLAMAGRDGLKLSVEYLVQQDPWNELFTPEQLTTAKRRLV